MTTTEEVGEPTEKDRVEQMVAKLLAQILTDKRMMVFWESRGRPMPITRIESGPQGIKITIV